MNEPRKKRDWKGAKTAKEVMAVLEADPEWVAERDKREAERQARIAERLEIEAPIVADLRVVGYDVTSVWDLVNTSTPYPGALPVLVKHLQREYPPAVKEGIARALAVRDAKFAWPVLVRSYIDEAHSRPKDGLAAALAVVSDEETLPDLITLFKDKSLGPSRVLLFDGLRRSKSPAALATLVEMADDPDLENEIKPHLKRREKRKKPPKPSTKLH